MSDIERLPTGQVTIDGVEPCHIFSTDPDEVLVVKIDDRGMVKVCTQWDDTLHFYGHDHGIPVAQHRLENLFGTPLSEWHGTVVTVPFWLMTAFDSPDRTSWSLYGVTREAVDEAWKLRHGHLPPT